jgi:integrase
MSKPSTGTVRILLNDDHVPQWHAKWTKANGKRSPWTAIDPKILAVDTPENRAAAKAYAASKAPAVKRGSEGQAAIETVADWFGRLHDHKESLGLATVKDMRGRTSKWILPGIEQKDMREITREDIERIVSRLDLAVAAFVKEGPGQGRLSPSTAANVWGDLQHALDEAVRSKNASLRVLTESPARNVRGPEGGDERQGQILYSDELLALVTGIAADPDSYAKVPMNRRRAYAMAVYTKARSSELESLTAADVDLAHGTITIARQADRKSKGRKGTKQTKTRRVRTIDIEPNILALVERLVKHPEGKAGRLLHMPPPEDRAELLRKDLRLVGVTREALHVERDPTRRAVVFHDLRDTGLTHMAVRGDSPILIQWAGGHTDFKTTQGYIERGQTERRRIGEPLPPLPSALFEPSDDPASNRPESPRDDTEARNFPFSLGNIVTPTGIEPVLPT